MVSGDQQRRLHGRAVAREPWRGVPVRRRKASCASTSRPCGWDWQASAGRRAAEAVGLRTPGAASGATEWNPGYARTPAVHLLQTPAVDVRWRCTRCGRQVASVPTVASTPDGVAWPCFLTNAAVRRTEQRPRWLRVCRSDRPAKFPGVRRASSRPRRPSRCSSSCAVYLGLACSSVYKIACLQDHDAVSSAGSCAFDYPITTCADAHTTPLFAGSCCRSRCPV